MTILRRKCVDVLEIWTGVNIKKGLKKLLWSNMWDEETKKMIISQPVKINYEILHFLSFFVLFQLDFFFSSTEIKGRDFLKKSRG